MSKEDLGDFQEISQGEEEEQENEQQMPQRVRNPRKNELIGVIVQRLGGNRMDVKATDGKIRNCRVPGRYKRRLWLRPRDIILIVPWEFDDSKADVIYKYPPVAVNQLRKQGILNSLNDEF